MKWGDLFADWGLSSIKLQAGFASAEFKPTDDDRDAAWELYIELLTRITTQNLSPAHGDEKTALDSVHSLFPSTREILKRRGKRCIEFTKLAVPVLNQAVRPFTEKWHRISLKEGWDDPARCKKFRKELAALQIVLRQYTKALAQVAGVEDLTSLEATD
jgi:hypothetical protein